MCARLGEGRWGRRASPACEASHAWTPGRCHTCVRAAAWAACGGGTPPPVSAAMAAVAVDRAMEMFRARQRNTGQAGQVNPDVVQIEIHLECSNLANLDVMSKSDPVRSSLILAFSPELPSCSTWLACGARHAPRLFCSWPVS